MKPAPIPTGEIARLNALLAYEILGTTPDPRYDDITLLASSICRTPISLVSLVDQNRQWFKSSVGLAATETPRDISFCGHAIMDTDVFVINDAFKDSRFADNPLVTGAPVVRFYAGAPLIDSEGMALGTLCVIDHVPRELDAEQIKSLQALSRQVVALMVAGREHKTISSQLLELQAASRKLLDYEQRLIEAARMVSLGEMAGGVAHEINNPLAVMSGLLSILLKKIDNSPPNTSELKSALQEIQAMTNRIASIVKGLLAFAGVRPQLEGEVVTVHDLVQETLALSSSRIVNAGIEIQVDVPPELTLECRKIQIEQVLANLLSNAYLAIVDLKEDLKWIRISAAMLNTKEIEICVSDCGSGISAEVAAKIMEPFFTTRAVGAGVGLGLSISKGLVSSHGGTLYLDPASKNTTFKINLPRHLQAKEQ